MGDRHLLTRERGEAGEGDHEVVEGALAEHLPARDPGSALQAVRDDNLNDVQVVTFGCRLNAYESDAIRVRAAADGVTDAVVFNTCAVTGEAVRQARQAIRKARRERPGAQAGGHRLRGADRSVQFRRHARGRPRAGQRRQGRAWRAAARGVAGWRHFRGPTPLPLAGRGRGWGYKRVACRANSKIAQPESTRPRRHPHPQPFPARGKGANSGRTRAGLRRDPERLRPPLHLLHHPVRPRKLALDPGASRGGRGARPRGVGFRRSGAHRRRSHQLGRRSGRSAAVGPPIAPRSSLGFRLSRLSLSPIDRGRIDEDTAKSAWPPGRASLRTCRPVRCSPATT